MTGICSDIGSVGVGDSCKDASFGAPVGAPVNGIGGLGVDTAFGVTSDAIGTTILKSLGFAVSFTGIPSDGIGGLGEL